MTLSFLGRVLDMKARGDEILILMASPFHAKQLREDKASLLRFVGQQCQSGSDKLTEMEKEEATLWYGVNHMVILVLHFNRSSDASLRVVRMSKRRSINIFEHDLDDISEPNAHSNTLFQRLQHRATKLWSFNKHVLALKGTRSIGLVSFNYPQLKLRHLPLQPSSIVLFPKGLLAYLNGTFADKLSFHPLIPWRNYYGLQRKIRLANPFEPKRMRLDYLDYLDATEPNLYDVIMQE